MMTQTRGAACPIADRLPHALQTTAGDSGIRGTPGIVCEQLRSVSSFSPRSVSRSHPTSHGYRARPTTLTDAPLNDSVFSAPSRSNRLRR